MKKGRIFEAALEALPWGRWFPCPQCGGGRQVVKTSLGTLWICLKTCGAAAHDAMEPSNYFDEEGRPRPIFLQDLRDVVEDVLELPIDSSSVPRFACEKKHMTLQVTGLIEGESYIQLECRNFVSMRIEANQLSPSGFIIEGSPELCLLKYSIHVSTFPEGFVSAYLAVKAENPYA